MFARGAHQWWGLALRVGSRPRHPLPFVPPQAAASGGGTASTATFTVSPSFTLAVTVQ